MRLTRREWIGMGSAAAGAGLLPSRLWAAQANAPALAGVVERVRRFAEADLASKGFPGMQIALVGPRGATATLAIGYSDQDSRVPATTGQLFQIGSISKSLVVMTAFVLAERGRLDLNARVQDLLPSVPLPPEPITVRHLIEHSSGLPNTLADFPELSIPGGRLWTGFAPGSRFSYCNLGYELLGRIIAKAAGTTHTDATERLVLRPLGMTRARPALRVWERELYANGHVRFREDIPWLPGARLTDARWLDLENAAGSISATAADMVAYLRYVGALAAGRGAPLFSDATAVRFAAATIDMDVPDRRYGNGLIHMELEGRPTLRHTGGILGFSSSFTLDRATGIGAYASVNVGGAGGYRPNEATEYAVALMLAAAEGRPLPERTPAPAPAIANPARLVGRWTAAGDTAFTVAERDGGLVIETGGVARPLASGGRNLITDHPALAPFVLVPEAGERPVLRLGDRFYGLGHVPAAPTPSPRLAALAGVYAYPASWGAGRNRVTAIGDKLYTGNSELREHADGSWRFADAELVSERIWFEDFVDGRPQRLNASGSRHRRLPEA